MSIIVDLPSLYCDFSSSFYNYQSDYIDSNFQEEKNIVYFLTNDGLIIIKENNCQLYKFKKAVSHFAKLILTDDYIICFLGSKIIFVDKSNPTKHLYTYKNLIPLIGHPCYMGEEIFFMDSRSLKKIHIKNKNLTELYRFKIEGKIRDDMSQIITYANHIVFFDRKDSLIFMNKDGLIEKKITFPINNQMISYNTAKKMASNRKNFFAIKNGNFKLKMDFFLNSLPSLYQNKLFLKHHKNAICIDENLNLTFLRNKKNINLLVPNKDNSFLEPISDIKSLNFFEKIKYDIDFNKIIAFYRDKFAIILRGKILSIKIGKYFKDYILDQFINPTSIFAWRYQDQLNIIILDYNGEIFKLKIPYKNQQNSNNINSARIKKST